MSVALIELVEMTATLNVVVSINSTTVMQTYWTAPIFMRDADFNLQPAAMQFFHRWYSSALDCLYQGMM